MSQSKSRIVQQNCRHPDLTFSLSAHAKSAGHQAYTDQQILNAMTGKRKHAADAAFQHHLDAFPDVLVLPGDAIDLDPKYPPQSFRSWLNEGTRNQVTTRRNTIYVAAPPEIDSNVKFMKDWYQPEFSGSSQQATCLSDIDVQGVISYLQAFYHGLQVKLLPASLTFTSWDDSPKTGSKSKRGLKSSKKNDVRAVALCTETEAVRIQVRSTPPPDSQSPEHVYPYSHQLNLNDMIDVALSVLPSDAYALLLLAKHDMYESDDDDFCCGRAWGGSRVAIVSGARYQPCLDDVHGVDQEHMWPASHCKEFVERTSLAHSDEQMLSGPSLVKKRKTAYYPRARSSADASPLERALEAHNASLTASELSLSDLENVLLFRLCRTVSHELGHCFGLDHCMYKACVMQGTASVAEDMRQPPYLCPVCGMKIAWASATDDTSEADPESDKVVQKAKPQAGRKREVKNAEDREVRLMRWKKDRPAAMVRFCEQYEGAFDPLSAWSTAFSEEMQS